MCPVYIGNGTSRGYYTAACYCLGFTLCTFCRRTLSEPTLLTPHPLRPPAVSCSSTRSLRWDACLVRQTTTKSMCGTCPRVASWVPWRDTSLWSPALCSWIKVTGCSGKSRQSDVVSFLQLRYFSEMGYFAWNPFHSVCQVGAGYFQWKHFKVHIKCIKGCAH